jgi:hypothetical protein
MSVFWDALDNRERALLIWTVGIVLFVLWKKDLRSAFAAVLRTLVGRPLLALLLGAMLYTAGVILLGATPSRARLAKSAPRQLEAKRIRLGRFRRTSGPEYA